MQTVLDSIKEGSEDISIDKLVTEGFANTFCVEAGGPEPGVGCAGRGIISAIETIAKAKVIEELDIDVVIYDVLGDVVCGGFAVPLRIGLARDIYLVTSGEVMALYAANNIAKAIERFSSRSEVRLCGIICNQRNAYLEQEIVSAFSDKLGSSVISWIPRDSVVQECELLEKTVIEGMPESNQAVVYKSLADAIINNTERVIPGPLSDDAFDKMIKSPLAEVAGKDR